MGEPLDHMLKAFFKKDETGGIDPVPVDLPDIDFIVYIGFGTIEEFRELFLAGIIRTVIAGQIFEPGAIHIRSFLIMTKQPAFAARFGNHGHAVFIIGGLKPGFHAEDQLAVIFVGVVDFRMGKVAVMEKNSSDLIAVFDSDVSQCFGRSLNKNQ